MRSFERVENLFFFHYSNDLGDLVHFMSKYLPANLIQIRSHWKSLSADRCCFYGVTKFVHLFLLWKSSQRVTPIIYFWSLWKGVEKSLILRRNIEWICFILGMRTELYAHTIQHMPSVYGRATPTAGWRCGFC